MTNNEVLRNIQHVLGVSETALADIFKLAEHQIDPSTISDILNKENIECTDEQLILFLNGLITHRRGKNEHNPVQAKESSRPLTKNMIFKKLRIAFNLKEDDLIELMSLADYEVSKNEVSAISRKPGHKHYRECSDEFMMRLLVGLTFRQWN